MSAYGRIRKKSGRRIVMRLALGAPVLVRGDATPPVFAVLIATLIHRMAGTGKACWARRAFVIA